MPITDNLCHDDGRDGDRSCGSTAARGAIDPAAAPPPPHLTADTDFRPLAEAPSLPPTSPPPLLLLYILLTMKFIEREDDDEEEW